MKYFSLFQGATCIKNRLDAAVVDCLQFEMSNLLIDETEVEHFESNIRKAITRLIKIFPKCTPIQFKCYDAGDPLGIRLYSLSNGPNIIFALFPVRENYSEDAK